MIDFASLFDEIPSPYMVLDANLNYVAANKAYMAVVKLQLDQLLGRNLFALFPNDDEGGTRLRRSLQTVLATGASDTIAFIPYPIPDPSVEGGVDHRYWTAVHTPLLGADGRTAFVVQNTVDVTDLYLSRQRGEAGEVGGGVDVLQRAREVERAYQESLAESAEFRRLFDQAPGMIAIVHGEDHRFSFANHAYRSFTGHRVLDGRAIREAFPEIADQDLIVRLDTVFRTGRAESGEGIRLLLKGRDEDRLREAFVDFHYQPIRDGQERITGVFIQGTDRTEQYRTLHHQRLLLDELNHRVKNTLSTVQSIARRSFRHVDRLGVAAFEARIKALSNVHDLISDQHWEKIGLQTLIEGELAAFGADRVALAGPAVDLTPRAAVALAMVFHELVSNALKYGSLSTETGSLELAWSIAARDGESVLRFEWREAGNPSPPREWPRGFGIRTLERILEGELAGGFTLDLAQGSVICRFEVPLAEVGDVAS
ncbi:hypothetical protein GCM10011390_09070 [Aureimonas endophytica]|uniref:Blue-light-activated histidine kinase n=1 Tax=Aureimonas endophytica TaxID=2027858 RepID=A0A916ZEQ7_9HYPH|nr:PAS domain-containing protein [Aureimonas endophytica]GGD92542.1 hypothetical protein GCM10011390_09070 [Aureimonas endophytica]